MFIESVKFIPAKGYIVNDLNKKKSGESIYEDSVCFSPEEKRNYLFSIAPQIDPFAETAKALLKSIEFNCGNMELNWYNFLGDKGTLRVGPFKYVPEIKRDI